MSKVLDPSKELRFTRTSQALIFVILGAICLAITVTLLLVVATIHHYEGDLTKLPFPIWLPFLPLLPMWGFFILGLHCAKHPYILLSPIGIEVFPFWKPVQNFQLIEWGKVALLEYNQAQLTMHYSKEKTGGVVLSLSPLSKKSRSLLIRALEGVMEQQKKQP